MKAMMKPVKQGLNFIRDAKGHPLIRDYAGAVTVGLMIMPKELKTLGFGVTVFDEDGCFRISFGNKMGGSEGDTEQ